MPRPEQISKTINEHIDTFGLDSLNPHHIYDLSVTLDIPYCQILKDVFIAFLNVEHTVTKELCEEYFPNKIKPNLKSGFANRYFNECLKYYTQAPKPKRDEKGNLPKIESNNDTIQRDLGTYGTCSSLRILHREDDIFLYKQKDSYLTEINNKEIKKEKIQENKNLKPYEADEGDIISKNHHILILLNDNFTYIGHIYIWPTLVMQIKTWSNNTNTLKFGSIRTSLLNTLVKSEKNIAQTFIKIISDIAIKDGYQFIEVAFNPIGPMQSLLLGCGFTLNPYNVPRSIKMSNIKCESKHDIIEISVECDMYPKDFVFPIPEPILDVKLLSENKIPYSDAISIYKALALSYPNIEISYDAIINVFNFSRKYNGLPPIK